MAKKGKSSGKKSGSSWHAWLAWLLLLAGLWLVLEDLDLLPTLAIGSWNILHLFVLLLGIKKVAWMHWK